MMLIMNSKPTLESHGQAVIPPWPRVCKNTAKNANTHVQPENRYYRTEPIPMLRSKKADTTTPPATVAVIVSINPTSLLDMSALPYSPL
jgi:hypothetical protein